MSSYEIGFVAGQIVGSAFLMFIFYAVVEALVFKRIFDDPVKGKLSAAGVALVLMLVINLGLRGPEQAGMRFVATLLGGAIVFFYAWRRGHKVRARSENALHQTFE